MMTTPMKSRYALLRLIAMLPIVTGLLAAFGFTSKAAEIRIQDKLPSAYTPTDPPAETAEKTASPENEDYDLLLVVDGEVTDFKTDPVTGLRSLTLPSGTYSIVGTENLTPEMREKYAAYLPGKAAVFFYKKTRQGKLRKSKYGMKPLTPRPPSAMPRSHSNRQNRCPHSRAEI